MLVKTHSWNLSPQEAVALQQRLAAQVITEDRLNQVHSVAGVDVGFENQGKITRAAVVVLRLADLSLVEQAVARQPTRFPYIPGLLSFRECPAVLAALEKLTVMPDLLLCDGQGIAHPRRFGIACHLGVLTDLPSIGVAKTRLVGKHGVVPDERGSWTPLVDKGETVGAVLRTRTGVKPIFISAGHRISLSSALHYVMACTTRYRLPETTRAADKLASGSGR
ncbi:deoxyribonuclease V [Nitrosococcus wardiae]|uniref:deoxyribonuclease V n=1 Tax=Nitrosococcus wardiae TaxID=1814290 RepID=UPI00141B8799|nr:deoxyribonuclease V [Nitrosococcus wardiae]